MALSFLSMDVSQFPMAKVEQIIIGGIDIGLEQVLRILQKRLKRDTPVGIRYKSYGKTKTGKSKTRKGKYVWITGPNAGRQAIYRGRWVISGAMAYAWRYEQSPGQIMAINPTPYGPVLETGGYPGIGKHRLGLLRGGMGEVAPRTVHAEGGIYSSRAVGGILKPLSQDTAFLQGATELIMKGILKGLRNEIKGGS